MAEWIAPEKFYLQLPRKYSAAALIVPCEDKYLMLNQTRKQHKLTLAGGVCELNESWAETAIREAKEEIGIDLEIDRLGNITYQRVDETLPGRGDSFQVIFFAKPITKEQCKNIKVDNDEITDWVLMSKDDIYKARDEVQSQVLIRMCFALEGSLYNEVDL